VTDLYIDKHSQCHRPNDPFI